MKKFLLSIFAVLFAFAGVQAEEVTTKYTFSSYAVGTQYAQGEEHALDSDVTLIINGAHLNGNVRLYDGSNAVLKVNGSVSTLVAKAGNKAGTLTIYGSNDGETWKEIGSTTTTSSYKEYTFTIGGYSQVKMESTGAQIRVSEATLTYTKSGVTKAAAPTVVGGEFVGSTTVVITNNDDDATLYYSVDDGAFEEYDSDFVINKDTKVAAYAQIGDDEETRSATVTAEFTRVAADPVLHYDATSFDDKITVSVTSEDDVYYTLDGTKPNAESTPFETALTLKATATLKVIAIDAEGYASAVVEQKFTKNESASGAGSGTATLVTDASTLAVGDKVVILNSEGTYALSTTQNTNNRKAVEAEATDGVVYLASDIQILTLENGLNEGQLAFQTGSGYLYAASTSSNYLKTKATLDNKGSFDISIDAAGIATIKADQSARNWLRFNENNGSPIFSCYTSGQTDVSIYKVNEASIEAYTLSVSAAGWATLCLNYDAEIPAGVTCYAVSAVDGEYATLAEVEGVIPANTGVIVEAEAGNYTFEVATEAGSDVANELIGTIVNTYITKEAYVLGIVDGKVGLYKAAMAGGAWLNNANKAYLPASAVPNKSVAFYGFDWDGTTGIEQITDNREQSTAIYDLTGRRVEAITAPGIYVVNGKKILVK
ncbi:MAG: chitobiase/beta-hexosaminidase C-terminal domain-containing protein [Bacteroidaceae bacterium]|nr:chitobiase/beta-hexosaminidase C-terminal domain-containing protein [Bacteroidaceae bacterium]